MKQQLLKSTADGNEELDLALIELEILLRAAEESVLREADIDPDRAIISSQMFFEILAEKVEIIKTIAEILKEK